MISKNQLTLLNNMMKYMNDKDKQVLDDYLTFHNILMTMYARHVFRFHSNWKKVKVMYNVNYEYIRENELNYEFYELEKKIKEYIHLIYNKNKFDKIKFDKYIKDFTDHIRYSMKRLLSDIYVPFRFKSPKVTEIINKYKNDEYIMKYEKIKYEKKSTKLNYEVLEKILKDNNYFVYSDYSNIQVCVD
jgi:hypothetical protein